MPHYENVPFEVPDNWVWTTVGEIGDVVTGSTPTKDIAEFYGGDIPFYKPNDLEQGINTRVSSDTLTSLGFMQSRRLPKGSVLVTCIGATIGKTGMISVEGACNQQINAIVPSYLINPSYIYYTCISGYFQMHIKSNASATTLPIINKNNFCRLQVPLPTLPEQHRIVAEIERWFALIDQIEQGKADLQTAIKQAKKKILDLAIHGKLVPQDPNDEPASELLKRINPKAKITCDNAHYENVPDSWYWTTLGEVCELVTGSTPNKLHPEYYGGNFPFYKPSDLDEGRHVTIPSEYLSDEGKNVSRIIPVGATAICCIGSIGKSGYIEREGTTNQQINTAVPSKALYPLYLYYFCNSKFFIEELTADSSAITISIVNKSKLSKMLISLPPYNEQQCIVAKIEELFAELDKIESSLQV